MSGEQRQAEAAEARIAAAMRWALIEEGIPAHLIVEGTLGALLALAVAGGVTDQTAKRMRLVADMVEAAAKAECKTCLAAMTTAGSA